MKDRGNDVEKARLIDDDEMKKSSPPTSEQKLARVVTRDDAAWEASPSR